VGYEVLRHADPGAVAADRRRVNTGPLRHDLEPTRHVAGIKGTTDVVAAIHRPEDWASIDASRNQGYLPELCENLP